MRTAELTSAAVAACAALLEAEDEYETARDMRIDPGSLREMRLSVTAARRAFRRACEACA